MSGQFRWMSGSARIPSRWDLRLFGWHLVANGDEEAAHIPQLLDGRYATRCGDWRSLTPDPLTLAIGVDCAHERTEMISAGLGEALGMQVGLGELAVRLTRLAERSYSLPRHRRVGPLTLDLLHRDARSGARWLALHPREFAVLWRLADRPGERVGRSCLLTDVWRLAHVPETNSLEVHISRLRAKLAPAEAAWLVQTDPRGGYRLALDSGDARDHKRHTLPQPEPARWPTIV